MLTLIKFAIRIIIIYSASLNNYKQRSATIHYFIYFHLSTSLCMVFRSYENIYMK